VPFPTPFCTVGDPPAEDGGMGQWGGGERRENPKSEVRNPKGKRIAGRGLASFCCGAIVLGALGLGIGVTGERRIGDGIVVGCCRLLSDAARWGKWAGFLLRGRGLSVVRGRSEHASLPPLPFRWSGKRAVGEYAHPTLLKPPILLQTLSYPIIRNTAWNGKCSGDSGIFVG
jgi:hypothetical protein